MRKKSFGPGHLEKLLKKLQKEELKEYALALTFKELNLVAQMLGAFFESTCEEKKRFSEESIEAIIQVLFKIKDELENTKRIN